MEDKKLCLITGEIRYAYFLSKLVIAKLNIHVLTCMHMAVHILVICKSSWNSVHAKDVDTQNCMNFDTASSTPTSVLMKHLLRYSFLCKQLCAIHRALDKREYLMIIKDNFC